MIIEIKDPTPVDEYEKGNVVFLIRANISDDESDIRTVRMVTTKQEYEKRLYTHIYQPVLFMVDLPTRLAYLYDCLNRSFRSSRSEEFTFYWRRIGEREWKDWFVVHPYTDRVYS